MEYEVPPKDFMPPQKTADSTRSNPQVKKIIIPSSEKIKSSFAVAKSQSKQFRKPRKALTTYNIFFKEERKRILDERGYKHAKDEKKFEGSVVLKKRGRPRGEKYKKKTPHHLIGFEDLSKMIGRRWANKKEEYKVKHNPIVENDQRRYKLEMAEYNKQRKALIERPETRTARHSRLSKLNDYDASNVPSGRCCEARNENKSNVRKKTKLGISNGYDYFVENNPRTIRSIGMSPEANLIKNSEITHNDLKLNVFETAYASTKHVRNKTPCAPESDKQIKLIEKHHASFNRSFHSPHNHPPSSDNYETPGQFLNIITDYEQPNVIYNSYSHTTSWQTPFYNDTSSNQQILHRTSCYTNQATSQKFYRLHESRRELDLSSSENKMENKYE